MGAPPENCTSILLGLGAHAANTLAPSHWEEMGARLIPSPNRERQPPPNPQFEDPASQDPAASSSTDWWRAEQPQPAAAHPSSTGAEQQQDNNAWGDNTGSSDTHSYYHNADWAPSPTPAWAPTPGPHPADDEDDEAGGPDHAHFMQRRVEPVGSGASSSHGPRVVSTRGPPRLTGAAAMIRRWLREIAALLRDHPMGSQVPLLLQQAMEAVGHDQEPEEGDNGTIGGPGPCKKRRMINMVAVARMRLDNIADDDGMDGLNQHQIREDLGEAMRDLDMGTAMFQRITQTQWGDQVQQGHHGLAQARKAIATALENTIQGDMDWVTPGWGNAMRMVLEDAEELIDEEGVLDLAHPADVVALQEGADEAPPIPQGDFNQQLDQLLRNIGAIAHFLQRGREQLRQFQAGVLVWRQANHQEGSILVDTQTTEEAQEPGPGDPSSGDPSGEAPSPGPGDPEGDSTGAGGGNDDGGPDRHKTRNRRGTGGGR